MLKDTGFYSTNIATLFVDAMHKHNGYSFLSEYSK
jgi:phosphate-selective porin OprO/OprP